MHLKKYKYEKFVSEIKFPLRSRWSIFRGGGGGKAGGPSLVHLFSPLNFLHLQFQPTTSCPKTFGEKKIVFTVIR